MTQHNRELGRHGEKVAEDFLVSNGARLLERNYHIQYAEVDLILEHEGELVAVEVKTRYPEELVEPEETIRIAQLRRIGRGLTTYAMDNEMLDMPHRIDVVAIVIEPNGSVQRLDHLRSVYPG